MVYYANTRHKSNLTYYVLALFNRLELLFFVMLAIFLIISSRNNSNLTNQISYRIINFSAPISKVIESPLKLGSIVVNTVKYMVTVKGDNDKLLRDNLEMQRFYLEALNIRKENKELKQLANFIGEYEVDYLSAQTIYKTNYGEIDSILVNIGIDKRIVKDSIVLGDKGLVGRVVDVYPDMSRVLLISNSDSRIPIITSETRTRGILGGSGTNSLKLLYLDDEHQIKKGEKIYTSSDGNMIIPGVVVGEVTDVDGLEVQVRPYEDLKNVNFVTISSMKDKGLDIDIVESVELFNVDARDEVDTDAETEVKAEVKKSKEAAIKKEKKQEVTIKPVLRKKVKKTIQKPKKKVVAIQSAEKKLQTQQANEVAEKPKIQVPAEKKTGEVKKQETTVQVDVKTETTEVSKTNE